ncbi:GIY-YIG nuclease family protein [Paenibacillus kobensis]|uniref:GIY-YIG nuclease family protein n=1 Tax=Paenibacillus kobensis TaxID=59841 RepID=UPI000FDCA04B|nr:GIY-YIG nuclease family protein [Paenibacillus kobensis]
MDNNKRKELVEKYQDRKREMGVFKIVHVPSGRAFIGSSLNLEAAWNRERFGLNLGSHACQEMQEAWNRDGESAFRFEIVEMLRTEDDVRYDYKDLVIPSGLQRANSKKYREQIEALEATCREIAEHEGAALFNA